MTYKVRWTQGREVWVRDLAGYSGKYVVFLGKHYASLQPEILMLLVKCQGSLMKCWGVTSRWTGIPGGGGNTTSRSMRRKQRYNQAGWATVSLETHPLIVIRVSQCGRGPKIQRNIEFVVNILVFMFSSWQAEQ